MTQPQRVLGISPTTLTEIVRFVNTRTERRVRNRVMCWDSWLKQLDAAVELHSEGVLTGSVAHYAEGDAFFAYHNGSDSQGIYSSAKHALEHALTGRT